MAMETQSISRIDPAGNTKKARKPGEEPRELEEDPTAALGKGLGARRAPPAARVPGGSHPGRTHQEQARRGGGGDGRASSAEDMEI